MEELRRESSCTVVLVGVMEISLYLRVILYTSYNAYLRKAIVLPSNEEGEHEFVLTI